MISLGIEKMRELVGQLPIENKSHWIDKRDMLPGNDENKVLGWDRRYNEVKIIQCSKNKELRREITHWMPLPKKPI